MATQKHGRLKKLFSFLIALTLGSSSTPAIGRSSSQSSGPSQPSAELVDPSLGLSNEQLRFEASNLASQIQEFADSVAQYSDYPNRVQSFRDDWMECKELNEEIQNLYKSISEYASQLNDVRAVAVQAKSDAEENIIVHTDTTKEANIINDFQYNATKAEEYSNTVNSYQSQARELSSAASSITEDVAQASKQVLEKAIAVRNNLEEINKLAAKANDYLHQPVFLAGRQQDYRESSEVLAGELNRLNSHIIPRHSATVLNGLSPKKEEEANQELTKMVADLKALRQEAGRLADSIVNNSSVVENFPNIYNKYSDLPGFLVQMQSLNGQAHNLSVKSSELNSGPKILYLNDVKPGSPLEVKEDGSASKAYPNYVLGHAAVTGPDGKPVAGVMQSIRYLKVGDLATINKNLCEVVNVQIISADSSYVGTFENNFRSFIEGAYFCKTCDHLPEEPNNGKDCFVTLLPCSDDVAISNAKESLASELPYGPPLKTFGDDFLEQGYPVPKDLYDPDDNQATPSQVIQTETNKTNDDYEL